MKLNACIISSCRDVTKSKGLKVKSILAILRYDVFFVPCFRYVLVFVANFAPKSCALGLLDISGKFSNPSDA